MQPASQKIAPDHYDILLIGAGGAGMCLLLAMHERGYLSGKRVLIIEPDGKEANDRTWCFWAKPDDPIARSLGPVAGCCSDYAWVQGQRQPLHPYRYYHLRSADLYSHVKSILRQYPLVEWRQASAGATTAAANGIRVEADGEHYFAKWVFDSRLNPQQQEYLSDSDDLVWQSFFGWRVRFPDEQIDTDAIRLMDFSIPQDGSTQFMYFLPTAANEALVEITRFDRSPVSQARAEALLEDWTTGQFGAFEVLETEAGRIPMTMRLNAEKPFHDASARHIPIGTAAGAVKGSTGYAFSRMFTHAFGIVEAMQKDTPCPAPFQEGRFGFYDSLLLYLLARQPAQGKRIFENLFEQVPLHKVLQFLDEKTNLRQEIPILLSLPFKPFLQALGEVYLFPGRSIRSGLNRALPLLLAVVALILQLTAPGVLVQLAAPLLLLGMIFPGIPHGALDHHLSPAGQLRGRRLVQFVAAYLGIMALILAVWVFSPPLGLVAFLLYSAWHFGETDMQHWGAFQPAWALLHGVSVLALILATHQVEFERYLQALGLGDDLAFPTPVMQSVAAAGLAGLLGTGLFLPVSARFSWLQTVCILLIGAFLPLLLAFGLYFIGVHSLRGWRHLQAGLKVSSIGLLRRSLPFSLGAFGLFALLILFSYLADFPFEGMIPGLFVFLAAISAPHIWFMHRFYKVS